jgi:hypothetical protein
MSKIEIEEEEEVFLHTLSTLNDHFLASWFGNLFLEFQHKTRMEAALAPLHPSRGASLPSTATIRARRINRI